MSGTMPDFDSISEDTSLIPPQGTQRVRITGAVFEDPKFKNPRIKLSVEVPGFPEFSDYLSLPDPDSGSNMFGWAKLKQIFLACDLQWTTSDDMPAVASRINRAPLSLVALIRHQYQVYDGESWITLRQKEKEDRYDTWNGPKSTRPQISRYFPATHTVDYEPDPALLNDDLPI